MRSVVRAEPALRRYVELHAQCQPDLARVDTLFDGRRGGAATQAEQGEVGDDRVTAGLAELGADQVAKLGEAHVPTVGGRWAAPRSG